MSSTNDEIIDSTLADETATAIAEEEETQLVVLKGAAESFLRSIDMYQYRLNEYNYLLKHKEELQISIKQNARSDGIKNLIDRYNESQQEESRQLDTLDQAGKELYNAIHMFQNIMNQVLGQEMQYIYVAQGYDSNGKVIAGTTELYVLNDLIDYLSMEGRNYKNTQETETQLRTIEGRFRKSHEQMLQNGRIAAKLNLEGYSQAGLSNLQRTHDLMLDKYTVYNSGVANGNITSNPNPPVTKKEMWKKLGQRGPKGGFIWHNVSIKNRGAIQEGYAAVILQHQESLFNSTGGDEELNNLQSIFVYGYVINADWTPGALIGDVSVGDTEYQIKSVNASMPGLQQFKTLANQILKSNYSVDKLRKKVKTDREKNYKSLTKINDLAGTTAEEAVRQAIADIAKYDATHSLQV